MKIKNSQIQYFALVLIVITIGITSRKIDFIPLFFGDILYAVMVYLGLRMILVNCNINKTAILALFFCFGVEFFQLCQAQWIREIRETTLGHYALGQGFLWSDLAFYTIGVSMVFLIDTNFFKI